MTLAPGMRLGPFEILAALGSGGMGEVYEARDTRLGRVVALKVLPEALSEDRERLARFETEARAASALNHPNIVTIHDIGRSEAGTYLAMERIDGQTLRERLVDGSLAIPSLLAIAPQIADGLAAAHEAGIVHRDLKPENVMIRGDGLVKILDFGLAKAFPVASAGATQAPTETSLTEPGVVLGTVGYMSPEQASGKPADLRSDQFSLGAILYEMTTGRRAFQRPTAVETLSAILRDEPSPIGASRPETPEPLRWVIERCLAKDPADRYASTRDLARDIAKLRERSGAATVAPRAAPRKRVAVRVLAAGLVLAALFAAGLLLLRNRGRPSGASAPRAASIAILPFQNVGGRQEDEYFSDGLTESLITGLARVQGLLVIARNSAFQYKNHAADVRDVGKSLGVRYVLEGSVQRAGDSVRVHAQLVDSGTGYHLWADQFDRPMKDIFALQDDLSRHIIGSLKLALSPGLAGAPVPPTKDIEAYDAYLRGSHHLHQMEQKEHADAIPLFERAVALDPSFAVAHAALARAYISTYFSLDPDPKWKAKAEAEIVRSLDLDPNLADAYVARGDLAWTLANGFPHEEAIRDFRKALEINPNLAEARRALGRVFMHVGLFDKAHEEWEKALRTDPRDMWVLYRKAGLYLFDAQPERALAELRKYPELENSQDAVLALLWLNRDSEAAAVMEKALRNPPETEIHATRAILLARQGDARGAEEAIASAIRLGKGLGHFHHAAYDIACAYAVMGRKSDALEWLRRTAADGFPCYPLFQRDPLLDSLRTAPGFDAFLAEQKAGHDRYRATL